MTDCSTHAADRFGVRDALVRQRVTISLFVFSGLMLKDLVAGTSPRDTGNFDDPLAMTGLIAVLMGMAVRSWAAGVIHKSKVLATTGPYRICRHPLYLGSLLMMFGFCVLFGNLLDACVVFGPILGIYLLTIQREERRLAERHGMAWVHYSALTPQFFPYRPSLELGDGWSLAQWVDNREYKAALTSTAALLALHFWRVL